MNKPWGLEKHSAEHWEDLYWQSIKRYPEMNAKYQRQQEEIARLFQLIKELSTDITVLDNLCHWKYFSVKGQTIYFDFLALRSTLLRKQQYLETIKTNYQVSVQICAELREDNERLRKEIEGQRRSLCTSKYI